MFSDKPSLAQTLALNTTSAPLSKDQKLFKNLIDKIEVRRLRLTSWNETLPSFRHQRARDLLPLLAQERALKAQLAERLDQVHSQLGLASTERRKLSEVVIDLTVSLLEQGEPDEGLKALYNKHAKSDFDAEESAQLEQLKAMLQDTLGIDLVDDPDLRSPEAVIERLQQEFQAQEEAKRTATPRRRSAKQQASDARREAEAKQLSQSVREIYRKLASALHPDREPDPIERQRKTLLMQQANEAYERGALLELLELQLQQEHIEPSHLAAFDGERLARFIKILRDQLRQLDLELALIEQSLVVEFGIPPFTKPSPTKLMAQLRADVASTKIELRELQLKLDTVGETRRLKAWLKSLKPFPRQPDFDRLF